MRLIWLLLFDQLIYLPNENQKGDFWHSCEECVLNNILKVLMGGGKANGRTEEECNDF